MNRLTIIIILFFLISSCNNGVFFDNPQPQSSKESIDIPENLIGEWIADSKESKKEISISKNYIVFENNKYTIDSNLILLKNMHGLYANLKKDSLGWNCYNIIHNDSNLYIYSVVGVDLNRPPHKINGEKVQNSEKSFYDMAKFDVTYLDSNTTIIHNIDIINLHRIFNYENASNFKRK